MKRDGLMTNKKNALYIIGGPIISIIATFLLESTLTLPGAQAVGVLLWCIFWWVTRPFNIAIVALVPVIANAFLNIVPTSTLTSQYASESIILIFGSGLLSLPWAKVGLDKRLALKTLSLIGPSMKSQIVVWILASVLLSIAMPNVAVCALLVPIAVSMLRAVGNENIQESGPATTILLCIGWGAGIGGAGSPIGGAMNLAAIQYLEEFMGAEFMYIDWLYRMMPYFIVSIIVLLIYMLCMPMKVKYLEGSKDYFKESYAELGPVKKDEKICLTLFVLAMGGAFLRPWFAHILPSLVPALVFLTLGALMFIIPYGDGDEPLLTWAEAQKNTMWGMMILFGGGLALGSLINGSGASTELAKLLTAMNLQNEIVILIIITVFARLISEFTNSTTSAAVMIPIVLSFTQELGLNSIAYWFICVMAYNAEFVLPISVRAIPVAYGLNPNIMMKKGVLITMISMVIVVIVGWICLNYWDTFGILPYYVGN